MAEPPRKNERMQTDATKKLAEIFGRINMHDLPAISDVVTELIELTGNRSATADTLAETILRDYSLTAKILQVANSAYYFRGVQITSVARAVMLLGLNTVRELAMAIALIDEFIKAGVEEQGISKLLAQSHISAAFSKMFARDQNLRIPVEEAFICALLHNLGKIIIYVYLPEMYREIESKTRNGYTEQQAALQVLDGLTFAQVGQEIARFWNFSENIVGTMSAVTPAENDKYSPDAILQHLAAFSNQLVDVVCHGTEQDLAELIVHYDKVLPLAASHVLDVLLNCIETVEDVSDTIRNGIARLRFRSKLLAMAKTPLQ